MTKEAPIARHQAPENIQVARPNEQGSWRSDCSGPGNSGAMQVENLRYGRLKVCGRVIMFDGDGVYGYEHGTFGRVESPVEEKC